MAYCLVDLTDVGQPACRDAVQADHLPGRLVGKLRTQQVPEQRVIAAGRET
jgi:hypothetical protein